MGKSPTSSKNPQTEKLKPFRRDKYPVSVSTPPVIVLRHIYHFQQCVLYAGMVKPSKGRCLALAQDPIVSFLVGCFGSSGRAV
jgi:hypothetical protein